MAAGDPVVGVGAKGDPAVTGIHPGPSVLTSKRVPQRGVGVCLLDEAAKSDVLTILQTRACQRPLGVFRIEPVPLPLCERALWQALFKMAR